MATLQNIRNRSGLLIAVIGFAMLAFILMDLLSSGRFLFGGNPNIIMEVDGESISKVEFQNRVEQRIIDYTSSNQRPPSLEDKHNLKNSEYEQIIREILLNNSYKNLGIEVSPAELWDQIKDNPNVQDFSFFKGEDNLFDPNRVLTYIGAVQDDYNENPRSGSDYDMWISFEQNSKKRRLNQKYFNLIKKGLYTTSNEASAQFNNENYGVAARYIYQPYNTISDSLISISEKEINEYYHENLSDYQQEEGRILEYVIFSLDASEKDKTTIRDNLAKLLDNQIVFNNTTSSNETIYGLRESTTDSIFVFENTENSYYDGRFYKSGSNGINSALLDTFLFSAKKGDVFGPYVDGEFYKIAKLVDIEYRPDSVRARHILINPINGNNYLLAREKADSLKNILINGGDFSDLVSRFSEDPGSIENGGIYEWFEEDKMVPEFNDACFTGQIGKYYIVNTQFGVHLIELLNKKGKTKAVKFAIIDKSIIFSEETETDIYNNAIQFLTEVKKSKDFSSTVNNKNLSSRSTNIIKRMDFGITGINESRTIIQWAYNAERKPGDIQRFDLSDKYVVVELKEIKEKGFQKKDDVSAEIKFNLIKDKKGDVIIKKFNSFDAKDLDNLSTFTGLEIQSLANYKFISSTLPGINGSEPEISGGIFGLKINVLSNPYKGNNGVFVFFIDQEIPSTNSDYSTIQSRLQNNLQVRSERESFDALKEKTTIFDNRLSTY